MTRKPLVYVAGPYSKPDPVENTHRALVLGTAMIEDGLVTPVVPHLTLLWHLITPRPYEFWIEYDAELVVRCDALFRMHGESSGADGETMVAMTFGLPVFEDLTALYDWVRGVPPLS